VPGEAGAVDQTSYSDVAEQVAGGRLAASIARPKAVINWFREREALSVSLVLLLVFLLYLSIVPFKSILVYDEIFYVEEARSILDGGELQYLEHPPLGKLLLAAGISIFGDNAWGWRLLPAISGVAAAGLFYLIGRRLMGNRAAFLAFVFLAFETLTFNFARLAMLDTFSVTFMLLCFLLYMHNRYLLSGVALALSGLCKMTGLLGILAILVHWILVRRKQHSPMTIGVLLVSLFAGLVVLMPLLDFAATREWANPFDRLWSMLAAHRGLTFMDMPPDLLAAQALPWEWLTNPVGYVWPDQLVLAQISPTIWLLIIPSMIYMVNQYVNKRTEAPLFAILWFAATYFFWFFLVIATNRAAYLFYFLPSVGAVCIAVGFTTYGLWEASSKRRYESYRFLIRTGIVSFVVLHLLFFFALTPLSAAFVDYFS
jgi:4-amino-4-deoxy-L-arabinose transferase-like glycosyltransferase